MCKSVLLQVSVSEEDSGWEANSADPDQTPQNCGVWLGSTMFAQACLSEYLR